MKFPKRPDIEWRHALASFFAGLSRSSAVAVKQTKDVEAALDELLFGSGQIAVCVDSELECLAIDTGAEADTSRSASVLRSATSPGSFTFRGSILSAGDTNHFKGCATLSGL